MHNSFNSILNRIITLTEKQLKIENNEFKKLISISVIDAFRHSGCPKRARRIN